MRQHQIGAGGDAQRAEMMLADPDGMEAQRLGVERLVDDVEHQRVRTPGIADVMIVAQREIAEFHAPALRLRALIVDPGCAEKAA